MNWLFLKITDITEDQYKTIYSELTPSRKAHIDKKKMENDRRRSLAATYLLDKLFLQVGKKAIKLHTDENGKPYVNEKEVYISISHSDEAVVCAVSDTPVGIDIEKIKPVSKKLIEYTCTKNEKDFVLGGKETVDTEATKRFFAVWTAKEAFFKKQNGAEKSIRSIDTLSLEKETFSIDGYYITVL